MFSNGLVEIPRRAARSEGSIVVWESRYSEEMVVKGQGRKRKQLLTLRIDFKGSRSDLQPSSLFFRSYDQVLQAKMSDDLDVFDRTHDSTTTKIRNRKVKVVGAAPTSKDLDSSGGSTDTLQPQQQQPEEDDKDEVVYGRTPDGKSELLSFVSCIYLV